LNPASAANCAPLAPKREKVADLRRAFTGQARGHRMGAGNATRGTMAAFSVVFNVSSRFQRVFGCCRRLAFPAPGHLGCLVAGQASCAPGTPAFVDWDESSPHSSCCPIVDSRFGRLEFNGLTAWDHVGRASGPLGPTMVLGGHRPDATALGACNPAE
jgi:hypothetical protein